VAAVVAVPGRGTTVVRFVVVVVTVSVPVGPAIAIMT
jgi:hypothetical protein